MLSLIYTNFLAWLDGSNSLTSWMDGFVQQIPRSQTSKIHFTSKIQGKFCHANRTL